MDKVLKDNEHLTKQIEDLREYYNNQLEEFQSDMMQIQSKNLGKNEELENEVIKLCQENEALAKQLVEYQK